MSYFGAVLLGGGQGGAQTGGGTGSGFTYLATNGPSGLPVPIPAGKRVLWFDDFTTDTLRSRLVPGTGQKAYSIYSGGASKAHLDTSWWDQSHTVVQGSCVELRSYYDPTIATTQGTGLPPVRCVSGAWTAGGLAQYLPVPKDCMFLWAVKHNRQAVGISANAQTYNLLYPAAGQFQVLTGSTTSRGCSTHEWPFCGEDDVTEASIGSTTTTSRLHYYDPANQSWPGNPTGHTVYTMQSNYPIAQTSWHIMGAEYSVGGVGSTATINYWTNEARTDSALVQRVSKNDANTAFHQDGRWFIAQTECSMATGYTGYGDPSVQSTVYYDWFAILVPDDSPVQLPAPATILDLRAWKLTLPVDSTGGTSGPAAEVTRPTLDSFSDPGWFHADTRGDGVVFKALVGGATTSGSVYARSELREMTGAAGTTEAAWGVDDGQIHTLTVTQSVDHLPVNRPIIVCGQVHGADSTSVLLITADGFWPTTGTTAVTGAGTGAFTVKAKMNVAGSQVSYDDVLPGYTLGTTWTLKLVADGGSIKVYADLGAVATTLRTTITSGIPATGLYFKAGEYNQAALDNSDKTVPSGTCAGGQNLTSPAAGAALTGDSNSAYGQVTIYDVSITHVAAPAGGDTFTEDWALFAATDTGWADGSTHGNWVDVFGGGGTVGIETDGSNVWGATPAAPTGTGDTHASLLATAAVFTGDIDVTVRMKTVAQNRVTGAYSGATPNAWERAWFAWHYTDNTHFYYVALKTTGWELGKEDPAYPGNQRFLATGTDRTFPLGAWNTVHVTQVGTTITVEVDGLALCTFQDLERPYTAGQLALYTEDAHARFDDIRLTRASTGGGTATLPAQVLDLAEWKLTLPVNSAGQLVVDSGGPKEVLQPELATYSHPLYFAVNAAKNGVTFTAPANGAHTPTSDYPRSELREMTGSAGTTNAAWDTATGTHTLTVTQSVDQLPVAKPQTVCGQVHDTNNTIGDIIEILADGQKPTSGSAWATGTSTTPYTIGFRFKGSSQPEKLIDGYVMGQRFTVRLVCGSSKIDIYADLGNVASTLRATRAFSSPSDPLYFKAGDYTQTNPSKGDADTAAGAVTIYALTVVHS